MIESWLESCPLRGICSECGLKFIWSEVLHPEKYEPLWCVEFPSAGPLRRSTLKTYLMSFRPWRFWKDIRMSHDIRWRRIAAYITVFLLPLVLLYVLEQSAVAIRVRTLQQQEMQRMLNIYQREIRTVNMRIANLQRNNLDAPELQIFKANLAFMNGIITTPPTIHCTYPEAVLEAIFFPLRSVSNHTMGTFGGAATPYIAPRNLHKTMFSLESSIFMRRYASGLRREWVIVLLLVQLAMILGLPLGFILLPASLRRAKVRWRHLFRVMVYSLFLPLTVMLVLGILFNLGVSISAIRSVILIQTKWVFILALPIGLMAWWALAIHFYLKIPHGWVIAPALAFVITLLVLTIIFNFWPTMLTNL